MVEINLMDGYPKDSATETLIEERARLMTEEQRRIGREFGPEFFDGERLFGYGGYYYHPRFWQATVRRFRDYYKLAPNASVLDVGCAKGFMLYDFRELMPDLIIAGVDISLYAIENAPESVKPFIRQGNAKELLFEDNSFDLVISINTIHNLPESECKQALRELQRVSREHVFIVVDAWKTDDQRKRMMKFNITAQTLMHVDDWKKLFGEVGYGGDYHWFIP